jgi:hypothetical protein
MTKVAETMIFLLLALGIYIGLAALMIWGWVRWSKRTQPRTLFFNLSLIGFTFAMASALLAISSVMYAGAIGGFPFYDPLLLRIYGCGGLLSLCGIVFGVGGIRRPGPLRWLAPVCAFGTLLFWFMQAIGE